MNNLLLKLEKKFGRYSLRNLPLIMILLYVVGYLLEQWSPAFLSYLTLNPYLILHGQIWRLVTWVVVPPSSLGLTTVIMLFFYYSIGTSLENTWGTFRYNLYIFSGMLFTIIGAFALYGIGWLKFKDVIGTYFSAEQIFSQYVQVPVDGAAVITPYYWFLNVSTYYVNMSIFLAFAATFPNSVIYLYFFIPVKVKWLGYLYGIILVYDIINCVTNKNFAVAALIIASLLNFLIFFFTSLNYFRISPSQFKRRAEFKKKMAEAEKKTTWSQPSGTGSGKIISRHRCAVCGRTELDDDKLEFRFCSKCEGNYEYCSDHLYTHSHVRKITPGGSEKS